MPAFYETVDDLPEQLPVFPLEGALLLPRGQLPLNIFEPRYLSMFEDALGRGRVLGIIQPGDEAAEDGAPAAGWLCGAHYVFQRNRRRAHDCKPDRNCALSCATGIAGADPLSSG